MSAAATAPPVAPEPSVADGAAWLFWGQVIGNAGFFAAVLLLARALDPSGRGAVAFITVCALAAARVTGFGMSEATQVFVAQRPHDRPVLWSNLLLFSAAAALAAVLAVCGGLLALGDARPDGVGVPEVAILGAGLVASTLVAAGYTFLLGCGRFRRHALITSCASWLYAAALGAVWLAGALTVAEAALVWTGAQTARALALLMSVRRSVGMARPDARLLLETARFGLRALPRSLSDFLSFRIDQVLMGFLASSAALGTYAVAVNTSEILLYLPQATSAVILPVIAGAVPLGRPAVTLRAFRSLILVTGGCAVAALATGPWLIPAFFGSSYRASVAPFAWLVPAAVGYTVLGIFSGSLLASGRPGRASLSSVAAVVVGVALDLVLIPDLGATGAAIAASAGFAAGGAVALGCYRAEHPFGWRDLVVPRRGDLDVLRAVAAPITRHTVSRRRRKS